MIAEMCLTLNTCTIHFSPRPNDRAGKNKLCHWSGQTENVQMTKKNAENKRK